MFLNLAKQITHDQEDRTEFQSQLDATLFLQLSVGGLPAGKLK